LTEYKHGVDFLTLIADRKYKKEILKFLFDFRCHLIDVIYVKGTVKSEYFRICWGLLTRRKKL